MRRERCGAAVRQDIRLHLRPPRPAQGLHHRHFQVAPELTGLIEASRPFPRWVERNRHDCVGAGQHVGSMRAQPRAEPSGNRLTAAVRARERWRAVNPRTGRRRWSARRPGRAGLRGLPSVARGADPGAGLRQLLERHRPIVPPYCRGCGEPLPSWRAVSVAESRCARCRRMPSNISHVRAIGPYEGSLRAIVHALKYGGRQTIAGGLGARLRAHGADVLAGADAIVPVPLHPSRERARGFNQARSSRGTSEVPMMEALRRTRRTPVAGGSAGRHGGTRNVRGAFVGPPPLRGRGPDRRPGGRCEHDRRDAGGVRAPLLDAGAREVRALTAARAVTRPP